MSEDLGVRITIEVVEEEGGRYDYNISANNGLTLEEVRAVLAGALSLTILGEPDPPSQSEALSNVIHYLETEFVSTTDMNIVFTKKEGE
jgi:hypothetical protein